MKADAGLVCDKMTLMTEERPLAGRLADEERLVELARRFARGDQHAFTAFFTAITPRILPLISRFTCNRDDAEDTLQDVAIQLFSALPRFRGDSLMITFVYRVVVNVGLTWKKRHARLPVTFTDMTDPDQDSPFEVLPGKAYEQPERMLFVREQQDLLHEAIVHLPPQFRAVLVLADLCQLSYEEIAAIQCAPVGTVRSRLHRARGMLQEKILAKRELFEDSD